MKKYYEDDSDVCPPLRLDPCVVTQGDQVFLTEPLSHLICCIQQCVRKSEEIVAKTNQTEDDEDDDDDDMADSQHTSMKQLQSILTSLSVRLIETEMEDFEIDKNADFSLNTSVGLKNNINASLLLGIYEALIEYIFETGNCSVESCTKVVQLFEKHAKVSSAVKDKSTAAAGKKGKPSVQQCPANSLMSMQGIVNILKKILDNCNPAHENGVKELRESKNFLPYIIGIATQKLNQIYNKGICDGETQNRDKLFNLCCLFGRQFYLHYVENQVPDGGSADQKVTSQCLEGLGSVINIAVSHGRLALLQCLTFFEKDCEEVKEHLNLRDAEANEKIHKHTKKFQRLIITMLSEGDNPQQAKDICQLISIVAGLASHLAKGSAEFEQVYSWLNKVATDQIIDDSSVCKLLLSTILSLSQQTKNLPQLLRSICQDIHSQFGDIQEECEVEDESHFLVTKATHCPTSTVLNLALNCLEGELDDIEWVIKRHKAEMLAAASKEDEGNILQYISLYTSKAGHIGSRFEKLVTLVGRQLTQPTYNMIIFVQMSEAGEAQQAEKKKDKGKKKNGAASQSGMAKSLKQMKTIPNLVFAMEQLEKFLIQLSKKSKVNLMQNFKLSTSRDFRINTATVTNVVENGISSDEDNGGEESNDEGQENSEPENNDKDNEKSDDEEDQEESSRSELEQDEVQPHNEKENARSVPASEPPKKKKKLAK
ncbi:fanconi anemia group I protein-like [Elysia marginata]|uniref:Fanconi anemia group I protein-like n=1 Tax=Elysia marginata TaxID=1093978 RepID=A0AAV4GKF5_9GAST|nr:fanconi anemia group I protein-like [Elysia marginata]